jgi:hypothetical protein
VSTKARMTMLVGNLYSRWEFCYLKTDIGIATTFARTVNPRLVPTYVTPLMMSEKKLILNFSIVSQRRTVDVESHGEFLQVSVCILFVSPVTIISQCTE